MSLNISLLDKVMAIIENEVNTTKRWKQTSWRAFNPKAKTKHDDQRCKTSMCFAGWTVEASGRKWLYTAVELVELAKQGNPVSVNRYDMVIAKPGDSDEIFGFQQVTKYLPDGTSVSVEVTTARIAAINELGLSFDQAHELFEAHNKRPTLRRLILKFKNDEHA